MEIKNRTNRADALTALIDLYRERFPQTSSLQKALQAMEIKNRAYVLTVLIDLYRENPPIRLKWYDKLLAWALLTKPKTLPFSVTTGGNPTPKEVYDDLYNR